MKLLFVTHTLPNRPDIDGMTQVAFRLLGELSPRHAITIWSLAPKTTTNTNGEMPGIRSVRLFPHRQRSLLSYYLFGSRFPYYQTRYESRALHTALQTITDGQFDLVIVHSPFMAQYIADVTVCPVVVHAMDTLSTWFRKTAEHEWRPWKAMHLQNEARRAKQCEAQQYRHARAITFVSPTDEGEIRAVVPTSVLTASIPIGIDAAHFYPPQAPRQPMTLLFSGMMDYPPNVDAARWFCQEVWPAISSRFPTSQFRIVGKNPTAAVQSLASIPGVVVTGKVPSIADELRSATIAVSPLRFGTGFKIKVIEALACGIPLIASSEAMHGIDVMPGRDILVADEPEAWVLAITDLLRQPSRREELGKHGALAAQQFNWSTIAHRYEALYDSVIHG